MAKKKSAKKKKVPAKGALKKTPAKKKKRASGGSMRSYFLEMERMAKQMAKEEQAKDRPPKSKVAKARKAKIRKVSPKKLFEFCRSIRLGDSTDYNREQALHHGATPAGLTPIWYAVHHQMERAVEKFLSFGVPINVNFPGRLSLLDMAGSLPNQRIAEMLEEAGAERKSEVQLREEQKAGHPKWPTFLHVTEAELPLFEAIETGDAATVGELVRTMGRKTVEAIYIEAAIEGSLDVVRALFPYIKDREKIGQFTISGVGLQEATERGHLKTTQWLVESLREIGVDNEEFSYLVDMAAQMGQEEILDYLLACGFTPMSGYYFGNVWQKYDIGNTFNPIIERRYSRILQKMIHFLPEQKQERYLNKMKKLVAKKGEQTTPFWYSGEAEDV